MVEAFIHSPDFNCSMREERKLLFAFCFAALGLLFLTSIELKIMGTKK
jgi:hypothetical protein